MVCIITLLTHLSVLLQCDGTIVVRVVHVEEDWKEKETFTDQATGWEISVSKTKRWSSHGGLELGSGDFRERTVLFYVASGASLRKGLHQAERTALKCLSFDI